MAASSVSDVMATVVPVSISPGVTLNTGVPACPARV